MPIEVHDGGGMTITGHGNMPHGGISLFVLISAEQAMKWKRDFGSVMVKGGTVSNVRMRLNQTYPDRPEGPFVGKTAIKLLEEIQVEKDRQTRLRDEHVAARAEQEVEDAEARLS